MILRLVILILMSSVLGAGNRSEDVLHVRAGPAVVIDGKLTPGEWDSAQSLEIKIRPDWVVKVRFQHDAANLYFAFQGLQHGKEMRFPELLVDSYRTRTVDWRPGDFWLHSSANLCEGEGEYNVYQKNGVFQCSQEKSGWSANHFPLGGDSVMEILVSFSKLGIQSSKGMRIGFALDLTDTQNNWTFWPGKAQLAHPASWGAMLVE